MGDKLTSFSIDGIRTLKDFKLDLNGLTVLVGENGSGKSSVVEAFEIYRRFQSENFWSELNKIHGGPSLIFRDGKSARLGVEMAIDERAKGKASHSFEVEKFWENERFLFEPLDRDGLRYEFVKTGEICRFGIGNSPLEVVLPIDNVIPKKRGGCFRDIMSQSFESMKTQSNVRHPFMLFETWMLFQAIEVHLPFQSGAYWGTQSIGARTVGMRDSVTLEPTKTLDRFGSNLANAFFSLRNEASSSEWEETMELVRLGLGPWVESVDTLADAGGGKIALWIKARNRDVRISASALSDGQLSYLAFVALACLPTPRSVLVIDEIELHLHPAMIGRVMSLMKRIAEHTPVVLTTHSHYVLNCLDNPAEQIVTLELDPDTLTTVQKKYDPETLRLWLEKYDDVGSILDAGNEAVLFQHASPYEG